MVEDIIGDYNYKDVKDEWTEKKPNPNKVPESNLISGKDSNRFLNYNVGVRSLHWGGKTGVLGQAGYLNTKYFDKFNVKENFPKTYEMVHSGLVPEVEKVIVIDLDGQFLTATKGGDLGVLCKHLYDDGIIFVEEIKIPKQNINYVGGEAVNIAKAAIAGTKIKIDNLIRNYSIDCGSDVMLGIDSMSSYDQLCNDLFNIVYEDYMAKPKRDRQGNIIEVDFEKMFAFEKGINQKYWRVRNGWFEGALRDKRIHKGWQFDTYKMEPKPEAWLKKERASAKSNGKDPDLVDPYITVWAPKTMFHLDFVLTMWNEKYVDAKGNPHVKKLWADALMRLSGNQRTATSRDYQKRINLRPHRRVLIFEILEELAPYILGEIRDEEGNILEDDDLWM